MTDKSNVYLNQGTEVCSFHVRIKVTFWWEEPVLFGRSGWDWEWIAAWRMTEIDRCGPYDRLCHALCSCVVCLSHHFDHIQITIIFFSGGKKSCFSKVSNWRQNKVMILSCSVMIIIVIRFACVKWSFFVEPSNQQGQQQKNGMQTSVFFRTKAWDFFNAVQLKTPKSPEEQKRWREKKAELLTDLLKGSQPRWWKKGDNNVFVLMYSLKILCEDWKWLCMWHSELTTGYLVDRVFYSVTDVHIITALTRQLDTPTLWPCFARSLRRQILGARIKSILCPKPVRWTGGSVRPKCLLICM